MSKQLSLFFLPKDVDAVELLRGVYNSHRFHHDLNMGSKTRKSQRRGRHSDDQVLDLGKALATTVANLSISNEHGLCEDLVSGLLAAEECKASPTLYGSPAAAVAVNNSCAAEVHQRRRSRGGLCIFRHSCSYSVHAIQSLQNYFPSFIRLLDAVEVQLSQYPKVTGKPAIL